MTTLKNLKGTAIQFLDADPVVYAGTWSSGGSLNQAKKETGGAGLTPTASIVFGGVQGSPPSLATTESYNGTSWTEVNDMPQVTSFVAGVGTSTAAVAIAGIGGPSDPPTGAYVQEWNGSSWSTNPNAYPFTAYSLAGAGTATAAIISGGPPAQTTVNTFDGTSFTSGTAMNTGRRGHGSVGTTTANLVVGGETPRTANTELWNGSSWTEVNNYPAATQDLSAWGTSTSAIGALGYDTANTANSASWDGTSWTETADLSTARNGAQTGGLGTNNTEGLVAGGDTTGGVTAVTEEWSFPPITATTLNEGDMWFNSSSSTLKGYGTAAGIPATSWSSGGNLNTGRRGGGGAGVSNTAALVWGGENIPPPTAQFTNTESYNGTAWTELNDLNTKNADQSFSGTQTAAIGGGGANPDPNTLTESWNGSTWTEVADLNAARYNGGSIGFTASAHNFVGGLAAPVDQNNEFWNGTSWTEQNNLNTGRFNMFGFGNPASGLVGGGLEPSLSGKVESWDGTSWTETTDLNTARVACRGTGNTSSGIVFGGGTPSATGKTEFWNGSSWTEINDMSSGRATIMPNRSGGAVSAIAAGGPSSSALTEEWTTDNTLSTVTTS